MRRYEASTSLADSAAAVIERYRGKDLEALFAAQSQLRKDEAMRFKVQSSPAVEREVAWNYGAAAAAFSYDDFFHEHILTQGTAYTYVNGFNSAARDPLQHALPFIFTRPELAADVLRYTLREMGPNATTTEIPYSIFAHGIVGATPGVKPSDSELFVLNLAAELLLATKSTAFLSEELPPFGGGGPPTSVIELLLRCQSVVETVIGVGRHGLMRMQSGDWSDLIMSRVGIAYNSPRYKHAVEVSESSLNAAMASRVFRRWAEALHMIQRHLPSSPAADNDNRLLSKLPPVSVLKQAEQSALKFATAQRDALRAHAWNGSWFSRAWVDEEAGWVGTTADERLELEPQSWAMLGGAAPKGSSEETALIKSILTHGATPIGHSVYSKPYPSKPRAGHPGSGAANAWPAINHPLVIALARSSQPQEAMKEWRRNSLATQAQYRPAFWAGIWSGADYTQTPIETRVAAHGLAGWPEFPTYCTHRHSMPLWSVATGLAGVEFTATGLTLQPAVPVAEGAFEFEAGVVAIAREADGVTFHGWVEPQAADAACKITLRLHPSTVAPNALLAHARLRTWATGSSSPPTAAQDTTERAVGASEGWSEVVASPGLEGEGEGGEGKGTGGSSTFLVHDGGRCGNGERVHFVLKVTTAA